MLPAKSPENGARETCRQRPRIATAAVMLAGLVLVLETYPAGAQPAPAPGDEVPATTAAAPDNITSYGPDFFVNFPNAVTALDLVERIPAASTILGSDFGGGNQSGRRGFSTNDDRVLINGKRISGKSNNSRDTLRRISRDRVLRIDIIRGSSPDIKVSSQESMINVLLVENGGGGSGSFEALAELRGKSTWGFGGSASYSGQLGNLEYFLSADVEPRATLQKRKERIFDGGEDLNRAINERIRGSGPEYTVSSNLAYSFDADTTLRLNGQFEHSTRNTVNFGDLFDVDGAGTFLPDGTSERNSTRESDEFEIGSDFETSFGDALTFKLLGLFSTEDESSRRGEDFFDLMGGIEEGVLSLSDQNSDEIVGRTSLVWQRASGTSLELGDEVSANRIESDFGFFLRENGELVRQPVDNSLTTVKEFRNEAFIIHSWNASAKINLESQLFVEYSRISQTAGANRTSRTFFFLRPSVDVRWDLDERHQAQFSVRRIIDQLNFFDFASGANEDDEVVSGNTGLEPQKSWVFEVSVERTLPNDRGRIRVSNNYTRWENFITGIEIAPGVAGVGNAGKAWLNELILEASVRLDVIGEGDLLIEPRLRVRMGQIIDPITGMSLFAENKGRAIFNMNLRHDISKWGLSYGGDIFRFLDWERRDLDELNRNQGRLNLSLFVEKVLFGGITARITASGIADPDTGRVRTLFVDTRRSAVIDRVEVRDQRDGRQFIFALRGNF